MAECPECKRDSLEYSEGKRVAWCLYSGCDFTTSVKNYEEYASQFERSQESPVIDGEKEQAFA